MQFTLEAVGDVAIKITGAAAALLTVWFTGRAKLKKAINNGDDPLERRKDSITTVDHLECKKDREKTEDKLFDKIDDARLEVKSDFDKIYKRQDNIRKEICVKQDDIRKEICSKIETLAASKV